MLPLLYPKASKHPWLLTFSDHSNTEPKHQRYSAMVERLLRDPKGADPEGAQLAVFFLQCFCGWLDTWVMSKIFGPVKSLQQDDCWTMPVLCEMGGNRMTCPDSPPKKFCCAKLEVSSRRCHVEQLAARRRRGQFRGLAACLPPARVPGH